MLTKNDLQQLDTLITKRIHSETRKIVQEEIQKETHPIRNDQKTMKEDISQIRKDMKTIISFFDREYLELRKRVERIELHLSLPTSS